MSWKVVVAWSAVFLSFLKMGHLEILLSGFLSEVFVPIVSGAWVRMCTREALIPA